VERRKILPLPGLELQPLGHPARSQSLYQLRYAVLAQQLVELNKKFWEEQITYCP
jgi:hypothetical protein